MSMAVLGRVDREGRLIEADLPLLDLHRQAGGREGSMITLPHLARLVRLVQRIGISVSRDLIVAGDGRDMSLWVRAEPDVDGGVKLAITGWGSRTIKPPISEPDLEHDFLCVGADWGWECDALLRLLALRPPVPDVVPGDPLTRAFFMVPDARGGLPILDALAMQQAFDSQIATVAGKERVRLSAVPWIGADGRFAGFRGSATRLSDLAQAPATTSGVDAEAFGRRLDAALRGPLNRIVLSAETIRAQADGPLRRDYASYAVDIATAGRHLLALVGDLVDLQAIERADFRITPEPIDLADLARRAAGLLVVRAADRNVRIDRPGDEERVAAQGDFRRVLQILINLLGNAVRYSPEGGLLRVRCETKGATASIVVADQGRGIAPSDQARIFDKFERVDPAEGGGSGLGLYISRRLARAMGGDIVVESAAGQGARFTLTLPAE